VDCRGEKVVDIGFTIGDADARRFAASRGGPLGTLQAFKPTITLFLFDWRPLAFLVLHGWRGVVDGLARPALGAHDAQGHAIHVKGYHRMIERAAPRFAIHRTRPLDLLFGPGQIQLGRVLHEQDKCELTDALIRLVDVRLQDLLRRDFLVIKEAVTTRDVSLALQSCREADVGLLVHCLGKLRDSFRQTHISKLTTGQLGGYIGHLRHTHLRAKRK
jgi:hypothetical protein